MSMDTNHGNDFNKNTTDRNMNDKSVTAFLLSPRYRIYRHLLLQLVVVLITINVLWYEPLQTPMGLLLSSITNGRFLRKEKSANSF